MKKITPMVIASGNGAPGLAAGIAVLRKGGSALDAVEACARVIEADPSDTSVGRGGKPNVLGIVELDASLVDGTTHRVGAVGALSGYLHPISVARAVMERLAKARETPASVRRRAKLGPVVAKTVGEERGTVNFIARDRAGDIASAVSTSGWAYKYPGRLGDSPIVGAGNFCDTRYGGACCTGFGELAIRNVTAKTAVDRLASGMSAVEVARRAIVDVNLLDDAAFNIVVLAADGSHAAASNRKDRRYAWQRSDMDAPELA